MIKYSSYLPLRMFQAIWYGDKCTYMLLYNDCYRHNPERIISGHAAVEHIM